MSKASVRRRLGMISQDPVVFEQTVRYNVDPFEEFTKEQVSHALKTAHFAASLHDERGNPL